MHDTIVVGGGIMGCTVALHLARAGQRVLLLEKGGLCMQASGVNAGTLSIQIKRAALIPYALRGWELWRDARDWLGSDAGFHQTGGLSLAFTDEEAAMLTERMEARKRNGAPVEMIGANRAHELEPGLSDKPVLASWCALDGYASSNELGNSLRGALARAGVQVREFTALDGLEREDGQYVARSAAGLQRARRVVLAGGVWLETLLRRDFGIAIPLTCRVNQVSVTERLPPILHRVLGVATGLLSLKQSRNGTVIIGGGWQGKGDAERGGTEVIPENLVGNLRLASYAIPALREARVVRTWLGVEGSTQDEMPIVGALPGAPEAYVIGGVRGGFTIGPFMGKLLAQHMLGQEPEMPIFDPARAIVPTSAAA
ncbi:MAG: FAD-binding oxidoreductase [Acidisphaera sp.]|nr:FAD-binding oxidoreductase [Acidisphaera sp.]